MFFIHFCDLLNFLKFYLDKALYMELYFENLKFMDDRNF